MFMFKLEDELINEIKLKPYPWWRYIYDIFFGDEHGEERLNKFIKHLNEKQATINLRQNGLKHPSTSWML